MPVLRRTKTRKYAMIENAVFEDASLSWEARGVLGYLLTKPDHWQVRLHDLIRHGPAGEDKMRRILKDLERAGYLLRERGRLEDGRFAWFTYVIEEPGSLMGESPRQAWRRSADNSGASGLRSGSTRLGSG